MKSSKQIRQQGISKNVKKRLEKEHPQLAKKLSSHELLIIMEAYLVEIIGSLKSGYRVIFVGFGSFFTRPVKRQCSNPKTKEQWMTYKRRIRFSPSPSLRVKAETDMTEKEYMQDTKKKDSKSPAS